MADNDSIDNAEAKGPAKKLGLSKLIYGLGMSARDSLVTFAAATAALFPVMYLGQGKVKLVDEASKIPETLHGLWKKGLGERSGKAGKALAVSTGLATVIGYMAHVPGLFHGPKKISDAEAIYNAEVDDNHKLAAEVRALSETVKRQGMELTEAKMQDPAFAEKLKAAQAPDDSSAEQSKPELATKFAAEAALSNSEKLLARRAATENSREHTA